MSRLELETSPLTGDTIALRHWRSDDLDALVRELQDPEISRWVHPIPSPYGQKEGREFLSFADEACSGGTGAHLAALGSLTGELLGSVALSEIDWNNRSAHLGYWTAKGALNSGVARRASRLVIAWAFHRLDIERIELLCDPEDIPSQRVAEVLGFKREGLTQPFEAPPGAKGFAPLRPPVI